MTTAQTILEQLTGGTLTMRTHENRTLDELAYAASVGGVLWVRS